MKRKHMAEDNTKESSATAPMPTLKPYLERLVQGKNLTREEAQTCMDIVARGQVDSNQVAALLVLLRAKGETPDEVEGIVRTMRSHMTSVKTPEGPLLDIVGTGGDGAHTVNLSTTAAILAATCGARVAKHGNRSVSSKAGSADVLEVLGVSMLDPRHIAPCLERAGIAFMFAPKFHPAMKYVVPVRRSLGIRTIFNILGPLLNPARASRLFLGVFSPHLLDIYGQVLLGLGNVEHALVVHCCGLDELAPLGIADAVEIRRGHGMKRIKIDVVDGIGIPKCTIADLRGGSKEVNARIIRGVLAGGEGARGPIADTIALNAGAGLYVAGLSASIKEGFEKASAVLKSGAAAKQLEKWSETCTGLASS
eukprot:g1521.t1